MALKRKARRTRRRSSFASARPARRRRMGAVKKKKSTRRRSSSAGGGFALTPVNLAVAIGGALLANAYVEKLPIADPRYRYAAGAVGAYLLANKVPKQFKPALVGAAMACGAKAALAFAPQLLSFGKGGAAMGRLTSAQNAAVLRATQMNGAPNAIITGAPNINGNVITGQRRILNGMTLYV